MTISPTQCVLRCDHTGCMHEMHGLFLRTPVRDKAYRKGWRVGVRNEVEFYPRVDYCPRHAMLHVGGRWLKDPDPVEDESDDAPPPSQGVGDGSVDTVGEHPDEVGS